MTKEEIQRSYNLAEVNFVPEHIFVELYREHISSEFKTPEQWAEAEKEGMRIYGRKFYPLGMRGRVSRWA